MAEYHHSQTPALIRVTWKRSCKNPAEFIIATSYFRQYLLNPLASDIFIKCNGRTTISEILEHLGTRYPRFTREELEKETRQFLKALESLGFLVIDWDPF